MLDILLAPPPDSDKDVNYYDNNNDNVMIMIIKTTIMTITIIMGWRMTLAELYLKSTFLQRESFSTNFRSNKPSIFTDDFSVIIYVIIFLPHKEEFSKTIFVLVQ